MSQTVKQMLIGLAVVTALSYMIMGIGPRACAKNITETDGEIAEFAIRACAAVQAGDVDAFVPLLTAEGDQSVDEKYGWLPFSGARRDGFAEWQGRAQAAFNQVVAGRPPGMKCGDDVDINRGGDALDRQQGRVNSIGVRVVATDGEHVLELGSSVRAIRGRIFQGHEDAVFLRWDPPASSNK